MPITESASNAKLGWGTALFKGNLASGASGGYIQIAEVTRCGSPQQERERVERTHLASPDMKREYTAGMGDLATMDAECNFRPDNSTQDWITGIIYDYTNSIERWWKVVYYQWEATTAIYTFEITAYVSS